MDQSGIEAQVESQKLRKMLWDKYARTIYWMEKTERYYLRLESGSWITYSEKLIRQLLQGKGFFSWVLEGDPKLRTKAVDSFWRDFQNHIITHNIIKGAGMVGGRKEGIIEENGERFLITKGPTLIQPVKGDCSYVLCKLKQHLPGIQLDLILLWLKCGYLSIERQHFSWGQFLFLIGKAQSGKSWLQRHVITPILGGISAEPFTHMIGQTHFNGDLVKAGHLAIEDKGSGNGKFVRNRWTEGVKDIAVGSQIRCEPKGLDAFQTRPIRRGSVSINPESHNFETVPPLEEGTEDKLMVVKCDPIDFEGQGSYEIEARTKEAMPALIEHLLNRDYPREIVTTDRYGVISYVNPELREKIEGVSIETQTLNMIDIYLNEGEQESIQGNATNIWTQLGSSSLVKSLLLTNCRSVDWLGRRLSAMLKKYPSRISELPRTGKDGIVYKITKNGNGSHIL
jgi:hypothetical protein